MKKVKTPQDAKLIIQKLPCDMGIHRNPRKGTLEAPKKVLEHFDTDREIMVDEVFPNEFSLEETQRKIRNNTEDLIHYGKPIVSIGGDHSVSFPVIKALKENYPEMKLVWLDAHLDLKEKVNEHISHDVVVRELLENGFSEDEIFFVGTTRIDEDEKEFLDEKDISIFRPSEIEEFKQVFDSCEHPVYLSVDIDVLVESLAPGTGYPDGDMDLDEVMEVVEAVEPQYADLVEVAPVLDEEDKTLRSSREILSDLIQRIS